MQLWLCTAYEFRATAHVQLEIKAICLSECTLKQDVLGMFSWKLSVAALGITRMMATIKIKYGYRFFFVTRPSLLVSISSTFVALLLLLQMTFTTHHMVSISPLIPVTTVFKGLASCSEFIIVFKQFYSHSSLARGWDHSSLKLSGYIYIFVDLIHSRLGQSENQHGCAAMEVMGLNVTKSSGIQ